MPVLNQLDPHRGLSCALLNSECLRRVCQKHNTQTLSHTHWQRPQTLPHPSLSTLLRGTQIMLQEGKLPVGFWPQIPIFYASLLRTVTGRPLPSCPHPPGMLIARGWGDWNPARRVRSRGRESWQGQVGEAPEARDEEFGEGSGGCPSHGRELWKGWEAGDLAGAAAGVDKGERDRGGQWIFPGGSSEGKQRDGMWSQKAATWGEWSSKGTGWRNGDREG